MENSYWPVILGNYVPDHVHAVIKNCLDKGSPTRETDSAPTNVAVHAVTVHGVGGPEGAPGVLVNLSGGTEARLKSVWQNHIWPHVADRLTLGGKANIDV